MAIKPIASVDYVSKNTVNFEGKARKGKNTGSQGYQTSAMKAVPVAVLLAMSPMNQSSAAGEYNRMTVSPRTELVAPQEPQNSKLPNLRARRSDGQYFRVWGVSRDDNPKDAETFFFKYKRPLEGDKVAVLAGQFLDISDEPVKDGKYLMLYSPLDDSGYVIGNYEIAYVIPYYVELLKHVANAKCNNDACGIATTEEFIEWFGEEAVKNAPNIEDCTNFILDK